MPSPRPRPPTELSTSPHPLAIAMRAIDLLARVVPCERRVDWVKEWKAELWYRARALMQRGVPRHAIAGDLLRCGAGALRDAVELRVGAPDEWGAALREALFTLRRRPGGTTAAVGILVLAIGALTPVLLLSPIVLDTYPATTVAGLAGRTLIVSLAMAATIALLASASHAARILAQLPGTGGEHPRRARAAEALVLVVAAGLPGSVAAMLAAARLHSVLAVGAGVTWLATAALLLATFALLARS